VRALRLSADRGRDAVKRALVLLAACASPPQQPKIEHHARPPTDEVFMVDAPLFFGDAPDTTMWTLERHGHYASLDIASGASAHGTFDEHSGKIHMELAGEAGAQTLDCHRDARLVHVAAATAVPRGDHPFCSKPVAWQPADMERVAVLVCSVQRDELVTEVTMAAPPGLQAVLDDCCDDRHNCERRWDLRRRFAAADLLTCDDCPCYDALIAEVARCTLPEETRSEIDTATAALAENKLDGDHTSARELCRAGARFIIDHAARSCGWRSR
jgi:hypothetical protein